ncbi:MAG: glycosyltransferase [Methanomassiliicoccales archaeon]
MSTPLVSIVVPVYNGSDFLREALDSALGQTYPNIEVVVVNDGSNDGGKTREIALGYGDRIRYFEKENGGVATALNRGILESKGKYISWLSHDDAYLPDKLEKQVPVLERLGSEGRKAIVYSSFLWMDERSVNYGQFDVPNVGPDRFYEALISNTVFISAFRKRQFSIHGCTLLIPKAAFEEVGLFDESLRTTQDFDLWFKMNSYYDFVKVDGYFVRSREHAGQGTKVMRKERVVEVQDLYLRAFHLYRPGDAKFDLDLPRAVLALKLRMNIKAYEAAREALVKQGLSFRSRAYLLRAKLATRRIIMAKVAVRYVIRQVKIKLTR